MNKVNPTGKWLEDDPTVGHQLKHRPNQEAMLDQRLLSADGNGDLLFLSGLEALIIVSSHPVFTGKKGRRAHSLISQPHAHTCTCARWPNKYLYYMTEKQAFVLRYFEIMQLIIQTNCC